MLINQLRGTHTWSALNISSCTLRQLDDPNIFELFGQDLPSCCNLQWFSSASGAVFEDKMHEMYGVIQWAMHGIYGLLHVALSCSHDAKLCNVRRWSTRILRRNKRRFRREIWCVQQTTKKFAGPHCDKLPPGFLSSWPSKESVYIWKDCRCSIHKSVERPKGRWVREIPPKFP